MRIIDKDVDLWVNEVEYTTRRLAACFPPQEPYWRERRQAADAVLTALHAYQHLLNTTEVPNGSQHLG